MRNLGRIVYAAAETVKLLLFIAAFGDTKRYFRLRGAYSHLVKYLDERENLKALERFVRPGSVVIDAGANFGVYSLRLSELCGSAGQVYAFEPMPMTYACLARYCEGKINLTCLNRALAEERKMVRFYMPFLFGLVPEPALASISDPGRRSISAEIQCESIDSFCENLTRLDFIKMDIEGGEAKAIEGAAKTVERFRPVIQLEENNLKANGDKLLSFAKGAGYKIFYLGKGGKLLELDLKSPPVQRNFYLIPEGYKPAS